MISNLPPNWYWVKLGDVCEIVMGQSPPSSTYNTEQIGLPFFQGKAEFTELYPEVRKWCSQPNKIAEALDILVSVRAPVGSSNIANQKCCIGRGLAALRYPDCNKYIFYYIRLIETELDKLGTGSTFKAISSSTLRNIEIPLPPLPEQKKIVEKLEELFSHLDSGVASLKKAKEQIRLYRQSVLASAFSGKLVREVGGRQSAVGKTEMLKAAEPKVEYSNQLPDGWKWVKLDEVIDSMQYGTSDKAIGNEAGIPVLRMGNIQDGKLDYSSLKYFDKSFQDLNKYLLDDGDILFNRTNSAELVGKSAIYKKHHPKSIFASYLIRVKVTKNIYSPEFLNYYINSSYGRDFIKSVVSQNVGQANVNGTKLKAMLVPLVPINQQTQIVEEIEKRFSEADNLEKAIDESLAKSERLRQSILKQAFEGKLTIPSKKKNEKFEAIQVLGRVVYNLQKFNRYQGEMIIAKFFYLVVRLNQIDTYIQFKKNNFGSYSPEIKKIINTIYFIQKGNGDNKYFTLLKSDQLFKYVNPHFSKIDKSLEELMEVFLKYKDTKQRNHKIELLATVCKILEEDKASSPDDVYEFMKSWKTDLKKTGFNNKSEKFNFTETTKCLSLIKAKGWDKNFLDYNGNN